MHCSCMEAIAPALHLDALREAALQSLCQLGRNEVQNVLGGADHASAAFLGLHGQCEHLPRHLCDEQHRSCMSCNKEWRSANGPKSDLVGLPDL